MNRKKFDAIIVLSGGLIRDEKTRQWRTTNFNEGDLQGILGDKIRVIAGNLLFKKRLGDLIIVMGSKGQYRGLKGVPCPADVIKKELLDLSIPSRNIILKKKAGTTYKQLLELEKMIKKNNLKRVAIVSNQYHLPRISAMLTYKLKIPKGRIELISAEKIVSVNNKWKRIINAAYKNKLMKKRIALEKKGVTNIKDGTYIFK